VRRSGGDRDARLADLEAADAVMQCEEHSRPARRDLGRDAFERAAGQRLVGLVLEEPDLAPDVVVAYEAEKGGDRAVASGSLRPPVDHRRGERSERERLGSDREERKRHDFSIQALQRPAYRNLMFQK
jgi:hypothetical protein